jgi:hypothetical protein
MATKWPYFREYADTWRARLLPRSLQARAFVDGAKRECWGEAHGAALTMSLAQWSETLRLTRAGTEEAVAELSGRTWIVLSRDGEQLTVEFPDLQEQAQDADAEAARGRQRRAKAPRGASDGPSTERPTVVPNGVHRTRIGASNGRTTVRAEGLSSEDRSIEGGGIPRIDGSSPTVAGSASPGPAVAGSASRSPPGPIGERMRDQAARILSAWPERRGAAATSSAGAACVGERAAG